MKFLPHIITDLSQLADNDKLLAPLIDTAIMDFATAPLAEEGESAILTRSTELITQTSSSNHDFLWGLTIAVLIITFIFLIRNYLLSRKK